jgi:hypothetical protein
MKIIQRVWNDIRSGENIDQYLTIVAAITLAILNLAGVSLQTYLAPFTLAILALLAINSLGTRFRIDELFKKQSESVDTFFMDEFPPSYKVDFESADVLWLVGVSLHRTIKTNYKILEKKLRQGQSIRVLVINPKGAGIEIAVARNYAHRGVEAKANDILYILELLSSLNEIAPQKLEVRTIKLPLAYGVTATNPATSSGKLYIEHYGFRISTDSIPRYVLKSSDGRWYDFFKSEIEALWDAGEIWVYEKQKTG